ncbi:hypothetical protein ANCCAN_21284 [Ancylostoma caninum]|uniref:Glutaminase EF-hand domain-containing protein n=1 Tax=Ancylostoma caninum TaxID=29170 RepID=A0A368FN14_ANCCA|nr:hypothetical protein ANCCAN_21284 [Ancylostoma caninum]
MLASQSLRQRTDHSEKTGALFSFGSTLLRITYPFPEKKEDQLEWSTPRERVRIADVSTAVATIGAILQQEDTSVKRKVSKAMEGLKTAHEMFHPASPADLIFELFKVPNKDYASVTKLVKVLKSFGLREKDPRLKEMMERIQRIEDLREDENQGFHLRRHAFKEFSSHNLALIF